LRFAQSGPRRERWPVFLYALSLYPSMAPALTAPPGEVLHATAAE
jgi:hypothetical protein